VRSLIEPEDLDFERLGRRDYLVRFEHPSLWGAYLMPVTVLVGAEAEPERGLLATGSTHGDEYEGPVAIKHLLRQIRAEDVTGRIVLIPVLNVMAFKAGSRESPDDGVNLNRAFPGDRRGTITSRLADFIQRLIFPHVHVVLDIHSGGEVARFALNASFHSVDDREQRRAMEETARGFGTKFTMMYQNLSPGLLTSAAENLGKISLGTELGWGRALQPEGVSMAKQGILTAAIRQGQLRGVVPPNRHCPHAEQLLLDSSDPSSSLFARTPGHFEPTVSCGDQVEEGQVVGYLHDFERVDDPPVELLAPHDGCVLCQAWGARVATGQIITQVGKSVEWMR
jgi:predicted deacylase